MGKKNKVMPYTPGNFKALGLCTPYDKKGGTCIISALGAAAPCMMRCAFVHNMVLF
jgi:hypothetical protein